MNNIAIKVENLSKAYQLGEIGTGTISRDLERWWAKVRRKEDPFLRIGETNDRSTKGTSDIVWSLKDLNFDIEQGDAVGIIGRNGAGKSTLLKILSRVTSPTTGSIKVKGRIASLLEVGTGFHPELTGRENIFLNGAILGMRKVEIKKHFDAIVDFAGVERYIDTPVKRYSSGMYVRLAFAVAAHLESEILIVDEVLAVGDAEFQKKCLGKMNDVSKGEGRTVLFVSHNMGSIKQLCRSGIILSNGKVLKKGNIEQITDAYTKLQNNNLPLNQGKYTGFLSSSINFTNVFINDKNTDEFDITISPLHQINIRLITNSIKRIDLRIGLSIFKEGIRVLTIHDVKKPELINQGETVSVFKIPPRTLRPGIYSISIGAYESSGNGDWIWGEELVYFEIIEEWDSEFELRNYGIINFPHTSERKTCQ